MEDVFKTLNSSDDNEIFRGYTTIIELYNALTFIQKILTFKSRCCVFKVREYISLASFLWVIGKQNSPRFDAAKRGVQSGAILLANIIFIEKWNKNDKSHLKPLK